MQLQERKNWSQSPVFFFCFLFLFFIILVNPSRSRLNFSIYLSAHSRIFSLFWVSTYYPPPSPFSTSLNLCKSEFVNKNEKAHPPFVEPFFKCCFYIDWNGCEFEVLRCYKFKITHQRAGCSGLLAPDIIKTRTSGTMYIHCKRENRVRLQSIKCLLQLK